MTLATLTLPWPPSVNHAWRSTGRGGRMFLSAETVKFRTQVSCRVALARRDGTVTAGNIPGRLSVLIRCYPPDRRARDLDNLGKTLLDSLTKAGLWKDDSQIDRLTFERCEMLKGGAVSVTVDQI